MFKLVSSGPIYSLISGLLTQANFAIITDNRNALQYSILTQCHISLEPQAKLLEMMANSDKIRLNNLFPNHKMHVE